jgi:thiamine pyrophosphate-dependent acetolactate synthase large subunit-like protein
MASGIDERSAGRAAAAATGGTAIATARFDDKDPLIQSCNAQCAWGSDAVAEMLRRLDVRYIALVPGSSYRGLHDSLVNYLGNRDPKMMVCLHEEHAVAIAHGYAKVTEKPMAVAVHSGVGLMHASMAIYNIWCARLPAVILGATGPGDAELRRPWIDWIHTAKDQGALIRNYSKWDDEPRSVQGVVESVMRAHQIAATQPYGPTYVCLDVALQEMPIDGEVKFPDIDRFTPGLPPAPAAEAVEEAARLLVEAKKPVILMGRVSRSEADWQARIDLAEALGAIVLTDMKTAASFPTEHPLHPIEPRFRPSPAVADLLKEADVILSLDWMDLKGQFHQTLGQNVPVAAKVIHCSLDRYLHNGWSMDYYGLPPADLPILASPDMLVRPLLAAVRKRRGSDAAATPKWPTRKAPVLPAPQSERTMTLRDLALVIREFKQDRTVTIPTYSLGWPSETSSFNHPLDYLGFDSGGGVGSGPGNSIGVALALKGSDRLVLTVIGDGDYAMASNAFWTAAHMEIPMLVVVANNRSYYNDVAHQERMAVVRNRPVANKFIGQEMIEPDIDIVAIAKGHGIEAEGPVERAGDLAAALKRGEARVRAGKTYLIDARVDVRTQDAARGEHTKGRQK